MEPKLDPNGNDNSPAIQEIIDKSGSGPVSIPSGCWQCKTPLVIRNTTGFTLSGRGLSSWLAFDGSIDEAIRFENNSLLTIRNLRVSGPKTIARGLHVTQKDASSEGIYLENLHFEGFYDNICIGADTDGDVAEITLNHVWSNRAENAAYRLGNGTGGNVIDIRFFGCIARYSQFGVFSSGTTFSWRDGTVGQNRRSDFSVSPTTAPLVISGVRTEGSYRFYEMIGGNTFLMPVTIENVFIPEFFDPDGCPIEHSASCPLIMRNVVMRGGPKPAVMKLGSNESYPLIATFENVFSDSPDPFGEFSQNKRFTIIGGGTINPSWQPCPNPVPGIKTHSFVGDKKGILDFQDGRSWGTGGLNQTETMSWTGKEKASLWPQGRGFYFKDSRGNVVPLVIPKGDKP